MRCRQARSAEQMVSLAGKQLLRDGMLKAGNVLGVVAGTRQASGATNFMRLHRVTAEEAEAALPTLKRSPKLKNATGLKNSSAKRGKKARAAHRSAL